MSSESSDNKAGNKEENKPKNKVHDPKNTTQTAYVDYDGDGKISEEENGLYL